MPRTVPVPFPGIEIALKKSEDKKGIGVSRARFKSGRNLIVATAMIKLGEIDSMGFRPFDLELELKIK